VEREDFIANEVSIMDPWKFQNKCLRKPLESFLYSGFFFKNGSVLKLQSNLISYVLNPQFKDLMILGLIKSIDQYFFSLPSLPKQEYLPLSPEGAKAIHETSSVDAFQSSNNGATLTASEISIRKSKRTKIKL